jgi:hypothetical protein
MVLLGGSRVVGVEKRVLRGGVEGRGLDGEEKIVVG